MKKILITGKDSYIGTSFEKWMAQYGDEYQIDTVDVRGEDWKNKSFVGYDVMFHVAGIAHVSSDSKMKDLYYKVNRDLTIDIAEKAKLDGVSQFIFMSSIIVYGDATNDSSTITSQTVPKPSDFYGDSKLQAEKGISKFCGANFTVSIIRPPMIYGPNSKGNYPRLAKLARKIPMFPSVQNERSMLYIDHLSEFIRKLIVHRPGGVFYPQNKEYVNTSKLVKAIAQTYNRNLRLIPGFNGVVCLLVPRAKVLSKLFGNLKYDQSISNFDFQYTIYNFDETIKRTELNA